MGLKPSPAMDTMCIFPVPMLSWVCTDLSMGHSHYLPSLIHKVKDWNYFFYRHCGEDMEPYTQNCLTLRKYGYVRSQSNNIPFVYSEVYCYHHVGLVWFPSIHHQLVKPSKHTCCNIRMQTVMYKLKWQMMTHLSKFFNSFSSFSGTSFTIASIQCGIT